MDEAAVRAKAQELHEALRDVHELSQRGSTGSEVRAAWQEVLRLDGELLALVADG